MVDLAQHPSVNIYVENSHELRSAMVNSCYTPRRMLNQPLTKRRLGILLFVLGSLGVAAIFIMDRLNLGREGGIGPAQLAALVVLALLALIGLTLIPLGDSPA